MTYQRRNHRFAARIARAELTAARMVTVLPTTATTPTMVEVVTTFLDDYVENVAAKWSVSH